VAGLQKAYLYSYRLASAAVAPCLSTSFFDTHWGPVGRVLSCAVGLAGIWLAYGLYQAFSNIIFMMLLCVVIGGGVFFLSELLSLVGYWTGQAFDTELATLH